MRVLLVEDEPGDRWIISEILRARGHAVTACERAEEAWERYQEDPFPLALLDWLLPETDGLELCRRIRGHPEGDRTVIIVVTSRDEPEDLREVLRAGANDYISKPLDVGLMNVRLAVAERETAVLRQRHETRAALQAKTRETESLFTNLGDVLFTVDAGTGELTRISPATRQIFGLEPDEVRSDPELWTRLLLPQELRARLEGDETGSEQAVSHQYAVNRYDGTEIWVEASVTATRGDRGRIVRIDGVVSDVTDSRTAGRELAARNQELQTLYRISEILLSAGSQAEAYQEIVTELRRATGFPVVAIEHLHPGRRKLILRAACGIPDHDERFPVDIPVEGTLSGKAVEQVEPIVVEDVERGTTRLDPGLRNRGIRTCIVLPLAVSGEVKGTLLLAHTKRVEVDKRLLRWLGSVATALATLVDRLRSQEALVHSERRHRAAVRDLRQANEELEAFAYTIAHDLRTPLRTMEGFAHALLEDFGDQLSPEARDYVRRIITAGQQSEALMGDLLDYSRFSFQDVALAPVDLEDVVTTALKRMEAQVREADAEIRIQGPLPVVRSHAATLSQVVGNLLSNAIKFVPDDRTPSVTIRTEGTNGEVRLWVEDNGIGIPPGQDQQIFSVFERLVESGDRPGTGIGLAIVRRGMERLGGAAGVESGGDAGSRFWIDVPTGPPESRDGDGDDLFLLDPEDDGDADE